MKKGIFKAIWAFIAALFVLIMGMGYNNMSKITEPFKVTEVISGPIQIETENENETQKQYEYMIKSLKTKQEYKYVIKSNQDVTLKKGDYIECLIEGNEIIGFDRGNYKWNIVLAYGIVFYLVAYGARALKQGKADQAKYIKRRLE